MKYAVGLIIAILILAAGQAFGAKVTDVELSWQDGFTIARVNVDGVVRYTHQTEEAKDGRPFRVILDVLSATHHLGQKNYFEVPVCAVENIRTSQFAVKPEKIVRLVFDMKAESVYRIDSDEEAIVISFPYKAGKKFADWSAGAWLAARQQGTEPELAQAPAEATPEPEAATPPSAAQLNKEINRDHLASLDGDASRSTSTGPNVSKPDTLSAAAPSRPDIDAEPPEPTREKMKSSPPAPTRANAQKAEKPSTDAPGRTVAQKPQPKPEPPRVAKSDPGPTAKATPKPASKTPTAPSRSTPTKPAVSATDAPHPTAAAANYAAATPKKQPNRSLPDAPEAQSKSAPAKTQTEDAVEKKPAPRKTGTSRFRRSPTRPTKFQGTLVAEFPKRLVIQYKPGGHRDPFETLINETKQNNSPVERRVPNVEGLRLVGVIESGVGNSALLEDKDGYGYILKEGDKVRKGYVLKIRPERVFFQIFEYGWSRTVALNLESE